MSGKEVFDILRDIFLDPVVWAIAIIGSSILVIIEALNENETRKKDDFDK